MTFLKFESNSQTELIFVGLKTKRGWCNYQPLLERAIGFEPTNVSLEG